MNFSQEFVENVSHTVKRSTTLNSNTIELVSAAVKENAIFGCSVESTRFRDFDSCHEVKIKFSLQLPSQDCNVISGDVSRVYGYNTETKTQAYQ